MFRGLGPKITLGLFCFVLLLGITTAALVYWGFDRGQEEASDRSREGLELQGKATLTTFVEFQTFAGIQQFAPAAQFSRQAAEYIFNLKASGGSVPWDPGSLVETKAGSVADTRPGRITDAVAAAPLSADDARTLLDTAALDAIFPALFTEYQGTFPEPNFKPINTFFTSPTLATRFYPPTGLSYGLDPKTIDAAPRMRQVGPVGNPEKRTIWTVPYSDSITHDLVMTAYTPVYEGNDFRGILGVDLSIARLVDQLNSIRLTPSGFVIYFDSSGQLLRSAPYELLTREATSGSNPALATLFDEIRSGRSGVARVSIGGRDHFVSYHELTGVGGSLAAAAPVDELTAQAALVADSVEDQSNQTVLLILAMMAGIFVCALASSAWLTRRLLLDRISDLVRGTRRVAAGDYETPIAVRSNDELGDLAQSFNAMAAEVRQRSEDLERRVAERTSDLEALVVQRDERVTQLEAIAAIASSLTLESAIEAMLTDVARQVVSATPALACAIGVTEPHSVERLRVLGTAGLPEWFPAAMEDAWRSPAVRASRVLRDAHAQLRAIAGGESAQEPDAWDSIVRVPIVYREHEVGVLLACYRAGGEPPAADLGFLAAIADQVAVAIENAQLLGQASAGAAIQERQRLARELHDSVSQALYGIGLGARTARRRLGQDGPAGVIEPVDYILQLAETGLTEMRALIFELRPESLEEEGLVAALRRQVAATQARWNVPIDAAFAAEPAIPLAAKEALYRICQESLHNVVKHAEASHIEVRLSSEGGLVRLHVQDDGRGFDTAGEFPGHLGLRSMQERARDVGGTCRLTSAPGTGTTITVEVPAALENVA